MVRGVYRSMSSDRRVVPSGSTEQAGHRMTIVEFLEARLAEDETVALMTYDDPTFGRSWPDMDGEVRSPELVHSRRHDPARVLREVAAKRAIASGARLYEDAGFPDFEGGFSSASEDAVAQLARVYSDHPDFNPEWAI